jgi:hypothetical protein
MADPPRPPRSFGLVLGLLALLGVLMVARLVIGFVFSLLTLAGVVALLVVAVSLGARRGRR